MVLPRNLFRTCVVFLLLVPSVASPRIGSFPERGFAINMSPTRYNRVEGLFIGGNLVIAPEDWRGISLFGAGGYGRENKAWRHEVGLKMASDKTSLSFSQFNRTASLDDSLITTGANSFMALLFNRDYKDYFQARGGVEWLATHRPNKSLAFNARLSLSTLRNMRKSTDWSLFRRDEDFRDNPGIVEGKEGLISGSIVVDLRRSNPIRRGGTYLSVEYRHRFRDFEDNGLTLKLHRYQVMPFGDQTLLLRGMLASRTKLAPQDSLHQLYLGGIGTLRGLPFRELSGNRLLMFNADYIFQDALKLLDLVLFFDTGWIGRRPPSASVLTGFGDVQWSDFKSNIGMALSLSGQRLRLNIARRFDRADAKWVVTMRGWRGL